MQRTAAAAGSAVFFALAPGTIVGLVPWLITDWHPGTPLSRLVPLRVLGAVLVVAGTAVLVSAFARFVGEGLGTPAPVAPPAHLVVGGLYRYVRNPIYLALDATILGQAILLWRRARAGRLGLRVGAAGAAEPVRRAVRRIPAGGTGLVATPSPLAAPIDRRRSPFSADAASSSP